MNEVSMKIVIMLRELADGIERGNVALIKVSKADSPENVRVQNNSQSKPDFLETGGTNTELIINYYK